jgi:DNA-binding SARP family transcriptional activator
MQRGVTTLTEPWTVTLLGGLTARHDEVAITRFRAQKYGALLPYLAYHRRQMHAREVLVEMFWPDLDENAARNNLSAALSSLRHQLEPPGVMQGGVLRADRYSVGVNPEAVTTDVAEFETAFRAAAGGNGGNGAETAVTHLVRAVGLYRGALLPGFYEPWITPEQERLAGLFFDAIGRLVGLLEAAGDLPVALTHARHAVSVDPLREEGQQPLIRLLAAVGQPGPAIRQYKEFERLLEEVGDEPSPALRALARRIERDAGLVGSPTLPATPTVPAPAAAPESRPSGARHTVTFLLAGAEPCTDGAATARLVHDVNDVNNARTPGGRAPERLGHLSRAEASALARTLCACLTGGQPCQTLDVSAPATPPMPTSPAQREWDVLCRRASGADCSLELDADTRELLVFRRESEARLRYNREAWTVGGSRWGEDTVTAPAVGTATGTATDAMEWYARHYLILAGLPVPSGSRRLFSSSATMVSFEAPGAAIDEKYRLLQVGLDPDHGSLTSLINRRFYRFGSRPPAASGAISSRSKTPIATGAGAGSAAR